MATIISADGMSSIVRIAQSGSSVTYRVEQYGIVSPTPTTISWPCTITNMNPSSSSMLKVIFDTNLEFTSTNQYFICGSGYIQFGSENLSITASGHRSEISISTNYRGLIQNGTSSANGHDSIFIFNIEVYGNSSKGLNTNGGWIGRDYFARGASNNKIINCFSNTSITSGGGGIVGAYAAHSGGSITIIGCSTTGNIASYAGGITGNYSGLLGGSISIHKCFSSGNIGYYAGGICGANSENISCLGCYSTGAISPFAGGIQGMSASLSTATNCYSRGNISAFGGNGGGGIFGDAAGYNGLTHAVNCYSSGFINTTTGGIFGTGYHSTNARATNCYTSGTKSDSTAATIGGIFAESNQDNLSGTGSSGNYSEGNNNSTSGWNDVRARAALSNAPGSGSNVGTAWITTGTNIPYEIRDMGYTPYLTNIINTSTYTLKTSVSETINVGNSTITPIAISGVYPSSILSINTSSPSTYSIIILASSLDGTITAGAGTYGDVYTLIVRHYDSIGYSITEYVLTVYTPPSAPTSLSATPSNGSVSVAFTAPSINGGVAINNYEYSVDDGISYTAFSPATISTSVIISGLTNGTAYNIKLRAVNSVGAGDASTRVVATPRTTPGAPTSLNTTPGNGSASVAFTPPTDNGGNPIIKYVYTIDNGITYNDLPTPSNLITGLTNGTTYNIKLRAVNDAGQGAESSSVTVTPRTTPGAPTGLSATPGDGEVSIEFTPPTDNGGNAISNYAYSINNGGSYTESVFPITISPITITGLTNGTTYNIKLRAVNDAGQGTESTSVTVTPRTTPSAPTGLSATPGEGEVSIVFTPPTDNGGNAITNYAYSINNGTSYTEFATPDITSPVTITGLTNGTTYNIKLRAINEAGQGTESSSITVTPRTVPEAPTSLGATPSNGSASVAFTPPTDNGGNAITNYAYSTDNGTTYTEFATPVTTSPITITGLTNGTTYNIKLRAVNEAGQGTESSSVTATPRTTPDAPTGLSAIPGNGSVSITFTQPNNGGNAITNYAYSINNGTSYTEFATPDITSPVTITGLTNGTTYNIKLRAINEAGQGTESSSVTITPRTTPGAPTTLSATHGNGSASVVFTPPTDNGGNAITNYAYSTDNGTTYTEFATPVTTSPATIIGLSNGTTYNIKLRAVNDAGQGTESSSVTVTPRTVPGAPTSLSATPGDETVSITFTPPTNNGGNAITNYAYSTDNGTTYTEFATPVTTSSVIITGLTNGTTYNIKLRAVNEVGQGMESSSVSTTPRTTPGAPTSLSATPGNGSASVDFTPPTDNGGNAITNYAYSINNGTFYTEFAIPDITSPVTITGLTNGTTYNIKLRAVNDAGQGTESSSVTVTPRTTPGAPTSLSATPNNGSASVAFTPPTDNGGNAITNYAYSTDNGTTYTEFATPITTSPVTITGLTNGTTYNIKLRAVNEAGQGTESSSVSTTPRTTPGAPTGLSATPGNGSASVTFTPPIDNGGSDITNYAYSINGASYTELTPPDTESPITIPGLTNGTTYMIRLFAINEVGLGDNINKIGSLFAQTFVTPRTTPGAPTGLSASASNTTVSVTFTPPTDNGGNAITNYAYSTDNGTTYTEFATPITTSPVTITGLTNGTTYNIKLRAVNEAGQGTESSSVSATPRTTPGAPTGLSATPEDGRVSVAFTQTSDGGTAIVNYAYSIDNGTTYSEFITPDITSPVTITGLSNGTTYSIKLRAINEVGQGTESSSVSATPRTTPGAPTGLSATPGNGSASVTFTPPINNGGNAITNYAYSINNGGSYTEFASPITISPAIITGLTNGTTYNIKLRAVNEAGQGTESSSVTVTPRTTPGAPTSLSVTSGNGTAFITFTPPTDNGGNSITNYAYSINNGGSYTEFTTPVTTSPVTISGLTNGTTYNIKLRAVNEAGQGTESSSVSATPRTTPGAPTGLSATPGDGEVSIEFTPPENNGGAIITNYAYSVNNGGSYTQFATPITTSPVTITGLTNGTTYNIKLRAVNEVGQGTESTHVVVIPRTTPGAPTIINTTPGDGTILVNFTPPSDDGGYPIIGYKYSIDNGSTYNTFSSSASTTSVTIGGLTNGTQYTIKLRAINGVGDGAESDGQNDTPRTIPDSPRLISASSADQSITINFIAPEDNGGSSITNYEYSINNGSSYVAFYPAIITSHPPTSTTSATITGLVNGTVYNIKLRAVNIVGVGISSTTINATPYTTPSSPMNLVAIAQNESATILFTPGSDGGNVITNYAYSINDGVTYSAFSPAKTISPVTITGLTNGTTYNIKLRSINEAGQGIESASVVVIPRTTSGAPTSLSGIPDNGSASIAFTPPTNNGGNAITNYAYSTNNGTTYTQFATPITTSPVIITGLTNGTIYNIKLRAVNEAGQGTESSSVTVTPRTTPGAPTSLSATPGNGTATIRFTPPTDNGGNAITNYAYSINNGTSYTAFTIPIITSPVTISGLTNGTIYNIKLCAVNEAGQGTESTSVTATPRTTPGAPTGLSATPGNGTVSVTFTPPANNGGNAISNYAYSTNNGTTYTEFATPYITTPVVIPGLINGTTYNIKLRAVNDAGQGADSSSVTVTPRTTPGAPTGLSATPGDGSVSVTFTTPTENGGNAITNYGYSINGSGYILFTPAITSSPALITGLTNGTTYNIKLRAVNEVGQGIESVIIAVTPRTIPDAPTSLSATPGDGRITLAFMAPTNNGGNAITNYAYSINNGTSYTAFTTPVTTSPVTISGLINGTTYNIKLRAVNAAGQGTGSSSITVTPRTTPGAPMGLSATPGNGSASLAFTPPISNGGSAITKYVYTIDNGVTYNDLPSPSNSITALTNGTTYTIKLRAVNAAGQGPDSTSVTVTPRTTPGAPTSLRVTPGDGSASVTFTPPTDNGGSVITKYVYTIDNGITYNDLSTPSNLITGLTNGTTYTIKLRAVNAAGQGIESSSITVTPRTTPGAPTSLIATSGNGSISISFTPPTNNGGSSITNYAYSINNGTTYTEFTTLVTTSPVIITGLANGTAYSIKLRAVNTAGQGTESSSARATPRTTPGAPTVLSATPGNGSASVIFTPPTNNGGNAITAYKYSIDNGVSYNSFSSNVSTTSVNIPSLINGTVYQIKIRAVNEAGDGIPSDSISVTPRTIPGAPTIVSTILNNKSVSVTFTPPTNNGGNAISNYMYSINNGATYTAVTPSSTTSPIIISGLTNGISYTIRIRAVNAAGQGTESSSVTAIPRTTPGAPIISSATPNNQTISVIFTPPTDNGGNAITNYAYSINGAGYSVFSPAITGNSVIISGLTNGTTYTIKLRAINEAGQGTESSSISAIPRTIPGAPTGLTATAGSSLAMIQFTRSTNNGGSEITHYKYSTNNGLTYTLFSASGSENPIVITAMGLTNGTTYNIKIRAVNVAGDSPELGPVTVTPRGRPSAPVISSISSSDRSAIVTFIPSEARGSAILNYKYSINNGGSYTTFGSMISSPVTIPGLINGTTYNIRLRSENALGNSDESNTTSVIPKTVPSGPTITSIVAGNSTAIIYFTSGSNGGSVITNYKYSINGAAYELLDSSITTSPIRITGLSNGTTYTIKLRAVNEVGDSVDSNIVSVIPKTVPSDPSGLTAVPGNGIATISFTSISTGGDSITNYQYSINDGLYQSYSPALTSTPLIIPGLINGTNYRIKVRAVNSVGVGSETAYINIIPRTIPSSPIITNITAGNEEAVIDFEISSDGGNSIRNYKYSYNDSIFQEFYPPITESPVVLTSLTNGTTYNIKIRAVNEEGDSNDSNIVSIIPKTTPSAPSILSVTPENSSAIVQFRTSINTGGNTISNYKYSINNGLTYTPFVPEIILGTNITTTRTISGLINGTSYTIRIRATNSVGDGTVSNAISVIPRTVPSAPTLLEITPGNGSATVDFIPGYNRGSPITNYKYSIDNGISYTVFESNVTTTPVTITGLTNGANYNILLRAVNGVGDGIESNMLSIIPRPIAGAPTELSASTSYKKVVISFIEGDDDGSPITNYEYSIDDRVTFIPLNPTINRSPITITNLENNRAYTFYIRAVNAYGYGISSLINVFIPNYPEPWKALAFKSVKPNISKKKLYSLASRNVIVRN